MERPATTATTLGLRQSKLLPYGRRPVSLRCLTDGGPNTMKKPSPDARPSVWARYVKWVQLKLKDWDPADDRGGPDAYVPRFNGVRSEGVEDVG